MSQRTNKESGVALIVVLLVMLVFTVMMLGFYYVTTGEQKIAASDRDSSTTYYGAIAGLETMSGQLAGWFTSHAAVSPAQVNALVVGPWPYGPPSGASCPPPGSSCTPGITYATYSILCASGANAAQPPIACSTAIPTGCTDPFCSYSGPIQGNGPLAGLQGIITPFFLTVVADGPNNTEVKMTRLVQEVAVPVFQYGIFSDSDLSFFAGSNFSFGGRIHTNGNLFLAEDGGNTLIVGDKTTAYKDIIRAQLSNGYAITGGGSYSYTVDVLTTSGGCPGGAPACRGLALGEGSVTGGPCPGGTVNAGWNNLSITTYNKSILNGPGGCGPGTGAKKLNLAFALGGGLPINMIQRAPSGRRPYRPYW